LILDPAGGVPAAPDAAAARPWLIVNPHSFRASRRGLARRVAELARSHGIHVEHASNLLEFHAALDLLRERRAEQIWVLAGDGTVHAMAQYLARPDNAGWSPALLLLGGGRANVVPRDCGGYPPWERFRAALQALREGRPLVEETLATLRVEQDGAEPQHGFFMVGAVLYDGVRLCREHRARGTGWLHRSWFADPWVLLKMMVQVWLGRSPLPPYSQMQVSTDGVAALHAPLRILLASTLQLREALYNPFAARGTGELRLTAVAATAMHFWRHLPAMLKGRFGNDMTLQQGYLSGRFAQAGVLGLAGYALDGELFVTDPARPVRLSAGIRLRVLRP
jgi:hypothetical protein